MRKYTPWTVLLYGMLFAALMWNVLHPPLEALLHRYSPVQWGWIFFIGICGTVFPFGLYFEGIKKIRPTHASITATLEPISAGVIAGIFLGEVMLPLQIIGGLIVIVSIIALQLNKTDHLTYWHIIRSQSVIITRNHSFWFEDLLAQSTVLSDTTPRLTQFSKLI